MNIAKKKKKTKRRIRSLEQELKILRCLAVKATLFTTTSTELLLYNELLNMYN